MRKRLRVVLGGLLTVAVLAMGAVRLQAAMRQDCEMDPDYCDGCIMQGFNCSYCNEYYLGGGDCIMTGDCSSWFCDCSAGGHQCYNIGG